MRKGSNPEATISLDQSHVDPVYKTIWINAKSGAEFFTASTDGMVSNAKMKQQYYARQKSCNDIITYDII